MRGVFQDSAEQSYDTVHVPFQDYIKQSYYRYSSLTFYKILHAEQSYYTSCTLRFPG